MLEETKRYFKRNKNNLIILIKDGINSENYKNQRNKIKTSTLLTFKGDDFTLKMNLSCSKNITKENILQTVTIMKKQLIDQENNPKCKKDKNNKCSLIQKENIFIDSRDTEKASNYDLNYNDNMINNKKESNINNRISEKSVKQSNKAIICKTNSELDKYTESENKKKPFLRNISKFISKSNKNIGEEIIVNNNLSGYDFINFNNDNNQIKDSFNNNESNLSKMVSNNNKNNLINNNNNIYKIINLESNNMKKINSNLGNFVKLKNNFIKNKTTLNDRIKKKVISSDFTNSINNNITSNNQNDNISEIRKLIIIKTTNKKLNYNAENKTENKNAINSIFSNSNDKNNLLEKKDSVVKSELDKNKKLKCFICENINKEKNIFVPKCQIHFLCKRCLKSYYEDIFENNIFSLKCPDTNCDKEIDFNILKNIINGIHYEMFINNKKETQTNNNNEKELYLNDTKLIFNSKVNNENIKLYTQKHVLDINSNKKFYMYNKNKDIYCSNCLKPTLFTKINGYFIKCLNCHYRICKYCLKEFEDLHMDIMSEKHCKIYYRRDNINYENRTKIINFLIQLFFVIAMYYLMFAYVYFMIFRFLKDILKLKKYNSANCCFRLTCYCFICFISFIFLLIACPFLIIIHPFIPTILSLSDY